MLTSYSTQYGPHNNYVVQNINSAEVEKPYLRGKVLPLLLARKMETESMLISQQIFLPLPLTSFILAVLSTMAEWTLPQQGKCWTLWSFSPWTPRHQKMYVQAK